MKKLLIVILLLLIPSYCFSARLLVRTKAGFKGNITAVFSDDHVFGSMEDIVEYNA